MAENANPNDNSILIGYYDPFNAFESVKTDLLKRFPIKKLLWKYDLDEPIKVIQNVSVQFKEDMPKICSNEKESLTYRPNRTYLHLMFVTADTIDLYRKTVRPLILEWLKAFVIGHNVAWGIVYVDSKSSSEKRSNLVKMAPFDKLRLDFGKGKQLKDLGAKIVLPHSENILRMRPDYDEEALKEEAYKELFSRITDLILITFSERYLTNKRIIELAKISTKGLELGQSLKLADSFADLGFLNEAIEHYDDIIDQLSSWSSSHMDDLSQAGGFDLSQQFLHDSPESSYNYDSLLQPLFAKEQKQIFLLPILFAIFIKQSQVFYNMSAQKESINHKIVCLNRILSSLLRLVNTSLRDFGDSLKIKEWIFALVEYYLHSEQRIVRVPPAESIDPQKKVPSLVDGASNVWGELTLSQRRILNDFATNRGFKLLDLHCLFQAVPLEQESEKYVPKLPEIVNAIENEESFFDAFEDLTTLAIQHFLSNSRNDTADLLSVDSAMLHFKRGDYAYAHRILGTAYEQLLISGWSMLGGLILETYLKCAKALDSYDPIETLTLHVKLFSLLKRSQKEESLHTYRSIKSVKDCLQLMDDVRDLSASLNRPIEFPLLEMLTVTVEPGLEYSDGGECVLRLSFDNAFPIPISIKKVSLTLVNTGNDTSILSFSATELVLSANTATPIDLFSRVMRTGEFSIRSIVVELTEKLLLVYKEDLQTLRCINDTVVETRPSLENQVVKENLRLSKCLFLMIPNPEHFHVEVKKPNNLDICTPSLDFIVSSGKNDITDINVKISRSFKLTDMSEPKVIEKMDANTNQSLSFEFPGDRGIIELLIVCNYRIEGREFEFSINGAYDLNLDVSIVVTDIFQMDSIFSKFKISAIDADLPFKVTNCLFSCPNGTFKVKGLLNMFADGNTLNVSGNQPATMFYQVTRSNDFCGDSKMADSFDFKLSYTTTRAECEEKVLQALRLHLVSIDCLKYFYVFEPVVLTLKFCWNSFLLSDEIVAKNLTEVNTVMNNRIKQYFAPAKYAILENTLLKVFESDFTLNGFRSEPHTLYIPVGAPSIDILHQVRFDYTKKQQCKVGEPIETLLIIKSSSKWANESHILASSSPGQQSQGKAFLARVHDDENWLYTGLQTQKFIVADTSAITHMSLSLLPVNAGEIVLPKVSIELVDQTITSDIVYENSLDTVLVVPELETVTFTL